jgi:hypothetical protein
MEMQDALPPLYDICSSPMSVESAKACPEPSQSTRSSPEVMALLKKFDELARQTTDFAAIIAQLPANALGGIAARLLTSAHLSSDEREQRWAVLLDWLLAQNKGTFTPSRQATRLLRQRLKTVSRKIRKDIIDRLAGYFS